MQLRSVWLYILITVLVTWLAEGLIPELKAGVVPVPPALDWLVQSLIPGLIMLTMLLPGVVQAPSWFQVPPGHALIRITTVGPVASPSQEKAPVATMTNAVPPVADNPSA